VYKLIKQLEENFELILLHKPSNYSSDIDFVSPINPKKYAVSLVEQLSFNYKLVNFIKEDFSDSIQMQFKFITQPKYFWIDILYDSIGNGYFQTQSNNLIINKVYNHKFKEFKSIFKYKFQIRNYLKYRKFFSKKLVIVNLFSNKIYRYFMLIKLLLSKYNIFYLGEVVEVYKLESNQRYTQNLNLIVNNSKISYWTWKFHYRFKGFYLIKVNSRMNQNLLSELNNISLKRLYKYVELN
jgi:hypothetical protein